MPSPTGIVHILNRSGAVVRVRPRFMKFAEPFLKRDGMGELTLQKLNESPMIYLIAKYDDFEPEAETISRIIEQTKFDWFSSITENEDEWPSHDELKNPHEWFELSYNYTVTHLEDGPIEDAYYVDFNEKE